MGTAFRALIQKDLRLFLGDRRAMVITLLVPVGIASFFAMIMGGGNRGNQAARTSIIVSDQDNSAVSREIVHNLRADSTLQVRSATEADSRRSVLQGRTTVALVLPPGFGQQAMRAVFAGPGSARPVVRLLYDPSHQVELQMLRGVLTQQVVQVVSRGAFAPQTASANIGEQIRTLGSDTAMAPGDKAALADMLRGLQRFYARSGETPGGAPSALRSAGFQMPCEMTEEAVTARRDSRVSGSAHAFAGMALQGLLFYAIDAALGILRERRKGLWKRLRAAPLSRALLLSGKLASTALIALLILAVVFGVGAAAFHLRVQGSVLGFAAVCVSTALMAASFGLLIAALGRTEAQSRGFAIPAVLAMAILGGAWIPTFLLPGWVQTVSLAMPSRWAVDGFDAMTWRGLDLLTGLRASSVLLVFTAVFGAVALLRFRWEPDA